MAVYPLIYDETGSSEWLFGGEGIDEEVYFTDLFELSNGQCLGCAAPNEPPDMNVVGKFSMLMDRDGAIHVKINDGLFEEYEQLVFGYGSVQKWDPTEQAEVSIPDLSGRWAFTNVPSANAQITAPPTSLLPLVFDIKSRSRVDPPLPVITPPPVPPESNTHLHYGVADMENQLVADLVCDHSGAMHCELYTPGKGEFADYFDVQMLSTNKMLMTNKATPEQGESIGTGTAVRID